MTKTLTLQELVDTVGAAIDDAPEFEPHIHGVWDEWFAENSRHFRATTGELIMESGEGRYAGGVGDHALDLGGVFVLSEDGYRGLLVQWLAAAKSVLQHRAVPA